MKQTMTTPRQEELMEQKFRDAINTIVPSAQLHAKWLNSLSLMENTGARKISRYEDPIKTNIIVLKHAAEEARHAYYLKKQIEKLIPAGYPDYASEYLLAPATSSRYLYKLDIAACRYLKTKFGLKDRDLFHGAYLLVTYAIEVRADLLYGIYQEALTQHHSKVNVKSIIAEEEGHLEEMTRMLQDFHPEWQLLANDMIAIEKKLFSEWIHDIAKSIS